MLQQEQNKRNLNHLTDKEIKINYKTKNRRKKKPNKQDGGLLFKIHETYHGNGGTIKNG